jgi:sarcosine oxidase gamma subunit
MTTLAFLSPDQAKPDKGFSPVAKSPLERALAHAPAAPIAFTDLSLLGKIEVRGDVDAIDAGGAEVIRITSRKALVVTDADSSALRSKLAEKADLVVDQTGALAGLGLGGAGSAQVLRRLTELDLDHLPAIGSMGHIQTLVVQDGPESYRLFFPQEYGDSMAHAVLDAAEGLR